MQVNNEAARGLRYPLLLSIMALVGRFLHEPIRMSLGNSIVILTQIVELVLILGAVYLAGASRGEFFISSENFVKSFLFSLPILIWILLFVVFNILYLNVLETPPVDFALFVIANNLFYPPVEEIEFRGFLLGFLQIAGLNSALSVLAQALLFLLAHHRYLWQQDWISFPFVFVSALVYGVGTIKSKTILGAYAVHAVNNILLFTFLG